MDMINFDTTTNRKLQQKDWFTDATSQRFILGQGRHLKEDITVLVSELQTAYPEIQIERAIAAGQCDLVLQGIMRYLHQITQ